MTTAMQGALRYFARIKNGTTPASGEAEYWGGDIRWATPEDLGKLVGDRITETKRQVTERAVADSNLSVLPMGSVLISTRAPIGHMAITDEPMAFNQGCRGLIPEAKTHGPYLYYLLKSRVPELNAIANGTTFVELSRDELAGVRIALPSLDVQQRIARFLDEKTARIDALIEKKQALLERLAEKRQALITHAVTKGLNPDVPTKPSGIDWLGDIPEHWDVLPLRRLARKVTTGRTPPSASADYFADGILNWFTPGDFSDGLELYESERKIVSAAIDDGVATMFPSGTVFLVAIGATLGKVAVSTAPGSANQQVNAMMLKDRNDPRFLAYFLHGFRDEVRMASNGNTLGILNQDATKSLMVIRPPVEEQEAIATCIAKQDRRDSFAIDEIKRSCRLLADYRTSMITAAVTGQLPELNG